MIRVLVVEGLLRRQPNTHQSVGTRFLQTRAQPCAPRIVSYKHQQHKLSRQRHDVGEYICRAAEMHGFPFGCSRQELEIPAKYA